MLLFSKGKKAYELISEHLDAVLSCYDLFTQAIAKTLRNRASDRKRKH